MPATEESESDRQPRRECRQVDEEVGDAGRAGEPPRQRGNYEARDSQYRNHTGAVKLEEGLFAVYRKL